MSLQLLAASKLRPSGHPIETLPQISVEADHAGTFRAARSAPLPEARRRGIAPTVL